MEERGQNLLNRISINEYSRNEENRKLALSKHHSSKCCLKEALRDAKISRLKIWYTGYLQIESVSLQVQVLTTQEVLIIITTQRQMNKHVLLIKREEVLQWRSLSDRHRLNQVITCTSPVIRHINHKKTSDILKLRDILNNSQVRFKNTQIKTQEFNRWEETKKTMTTECKVRSWIGFWAWKKDIFRTGIS